MTNQELALELTRAINEARAGERSLMAALFGIRHHGLLTGPRVAEILGMAELQGVRWLPLFGQDQGRVK